MSAVDKLNSELNRLFDVFNEHYYRGEIEKPIVMAQTNGKDTTTMGWCTTRKIWKDNTKDQYFYEITICAEYLYRNILEICATLLHEMVHLYNLQKGIKDTSRGNTYHNKRFKQTAEKRGLIIDYDKRVGWSVTWLNDEAKTFIDQHVNREVFTLTRIRHRVIPKPVQTEALTDSIDIEDVVDIEDSGPVGAAGDPGSYGTPYVIDDEEKPKQSYRKYVCPTCSTIIRATKDVNVVCGDCNVPFTKEEK